MSETSWQFTDLLTSPNWVGISAVFNILYTVITLFILIATRKNITVLTKLRKEDLSHRAAQDANNMSFAFHNEFASLIRLRIRLDKLLTEHEGEIEEGSRLEGDFWSLVAFYQRLHIAIQNDIVNTKLTRDLMGYLFLYCFIVHLDEKMGGKDFKAVNDINALHECFKENTDRKTIESWTRRAERERKRIDSKRRQDRERVLSAKTTAQPVSEALT